MPEETLLIRCDASDRIGVGHVMRCLALAQAWQDRGGTVAFASRECPAPLVERLAEEGIASIRLEQGEPGADTDLQLTADAGRNLGAKWVVADGYHFSSEFQKGLKAAGFKVLAVDDFGHCETWEADLVLNQNIYAPESFDRSKVISGRSLLGVRFALLRREFTNAERPVKGRGTSSPKLLITLGGGDPDNATGRVLRLLEQMDTRLILRVIVGGANPNRASLEALASSLRHEVEIVSDVRDMPAQYAWADGIVSAGGSSCWEWLLFGLAAAVVVIADNQRAVAEALEKKGLAVHLGWHADLESGNAAKALAAFVRGLTQPSQATEGEVDGHGASRVAAAMDGGLWLRRTHADDCRQYFEWVNDPAVRANSLNSENIEFDAHSRWFATRLAASNSRMYVGVSDEAPVGQVRFDRDADGAWEIDFSVDPSQRGRGLGASILSLAVARQRRCGELPITATVKEGNRASMRCFERLGFVRCREAKAGLARYRLDEA